MTDDTRRWLFPTSVAILALAACITSIGTITYDDRYVILMNERVHSLHRFWRYFAQSYWPPKYGGDGYRPMVILTFAWNGSSVTARRGCSISRTFSSRSPRLSRVLDGARAAARGGCVARRRAVRRAPAARGGDGEHGGAGGASGRAQHRVRNRMVSAPPARR
jgi:hypothetical protein